MTGKDRASLIIDTAAVRVAVELRSTEALMQVVSGPNDVDPDDCMEVRERESFFFCLIYYFFSKKKIPPTCLQQILETGNTDLAVVFLRNRGLHQEAVSLLTDKSMNLKLIDYLVEARLRGVLPSNE